MKIVVAANPPPVDLRQIARLVAKMRRGEPTEIETVGSPGEIVAVEVSANLTDAEVMALLLATTAALEPPSPALVLEAAETVFNAYRAPEFARPEASLELYCRFLGSYPAEALRMLMDVAQPDNILRKAKFLPTIAEIAVWLDPIVADWRGAHDQATRYAAGIETRRRLLA